MLLGCIICNIVFISLGIHSKHSQKHNNSAFWFLLQGCILQDVGLTISVRTLWGEPSGRRSLWIIFTVIAFVFTTIAPILYYFIPIPFASVSALIGGAIQPLIIVSIATVKDARSED